MRYLRLSSFVVLFLLVVSVSSFADSKNTFSKVILTGASGTVSGSFTFTASGSGGSFSNMSLLFGGKVFGGDGANNGGGKAKCLLGVCGITWNKQLSDGAWFSETILLNLKTGQYQDFGGIYKGKYNGDFNYASVPEGGAPLSYLMLSGFAMFAGILISGKRRRATRVLPVLT